MTIDEMMNGEFESALASMGLAWTEESLIKIYDEQRRTLIQDILARLKKLNYLQWERVTMVMGQKSFLAAGPTRAYGPFINQINVQQAAYFSILAVGDLNNIRGKTKLWRSCCGHGSHGNSNQVRNASLALSTKREVQSVTQYGENCRGAAQIWPASKEAKYM